MRILALLLGSALVACGSHHPKGPATGPASSARPAGSGSQVAPATPPFPRPVLDAVNAADRSADDRKLDAGRKPGELLSFFEIKPGMRVGELAAGGGYTTELLSRVVGEKGAVFAENPKFVLGFAAEAWAARLAKPVMKPVVRSDRELEDPFPAEAKNLDAVLCVMFYHDAVALNADRAKMNKAVFDALRPGGLYGIVDHSARAGSGTADASTLHRIDEKVVRDEVVAAGFRFQKDGPFLRNPADARDWNPSPMKAGEKRGTSDRFVLVFLKP